MGRFLNADALISTGQGVLGNNMFAYCRNNPVVRLDISGTYDVDCFDSDCNPTTDEKEMWGRSSSGSSYTPTSGNGPSINYLGGKMYPTSPGRHGGTLHRAMVDSLRYMFKAFGFDVSPKEERVSYEPDKYRYPDLIIRKNGNVEAYVQVGKSKKNGDPVAREERAILDLEKTGIPVFFYPYDD